MANYREQVVHSRYIQLGLQPMAGQRSPGPPAGRDRRASKGDLVPQINGGLPTAEKAKAMDERFKCVDCDGWRVFGVGNPSKARFGFPGKKFYFCLACGKWLQEEHKQRDLNKIAEKLGEELGA